MVLPDDARRSWRGTGARLLAVAVALQLALTVLVDPVEPASSSAPAPTTTLARAVPTELSAAPAPDVRSVRAERTRAVEQLLADRASALLRRDRAAFLVSVDPSADALRARQSALFDALVEVPLASWSYSLDPSRTSPPDARLDRRYGAARWWAPAVELHYALDVDERPVEVDHHLTFVRRGERWLLAADDDFALQGRATPRALWDRGPVVAVRAARVLVLGRPEQRQLLEEVAALTAEAVPRVTSAWGPWQERVVVLVPSTAAELSGLLGTDHDLSRIAAVATAELRGGADEYDPTGHRVIVNPETYAGLGQLGRRVVLTHEVTHVATRRASGPGVPAWLAEGFADHVGYSDVDLPVAVAAGALAREVRAGRVPEQLPTEADFDGADPRLSQSYQEAWLAVRRIVEVHGAPALLRLYRSAGSARGPAADGALDRALSEELGLSRAELTADWRATLTRQLG